MGPKKILVQKNFGSKNFGSKKFWVEKNLGPNKFWVQKILGLKKIWVQKKFGSWMCFFDFSKLKFQVWLNSVEFELRYCMKKNADTIGV